MTSLLEAQMAAKRSSPEAVAQESAKARTTSASSSSPTTTPSAVGGRQSFEMTAPATVVETTRVSPPLRSSTITSSTAAPIIGGRGRGLLIQKTEQTVTGVGAGLSKPSIPPPSIQPQIQKPPSPPKIAETAPTVEKLATKM